MKKCCMILMQSLREIGSFESSITQTMMERPSFISKSTSQMQISDWWTHQTGRDCSQCIH